MFFSEKFVTICKKTNIPIEIEEKRHKKFPSKFKNYLIEESVGNETRNDIWIWIKKKIQTQFIYSNVRQSNTRYGLTSIHNLAKFNHNVIFRGKTKRTSDSMSHPELVSTKQFSILKYYKIILYQKLNTFKKIYQNHKNENDCQEMTMT